MNIGVNNLSFTISSKILYPVLAFSILIFRSVMHRDTKNAQYFGLLSYLGLTSITSSSVLACPFIRYVTFVLQELDGLFPYFDDDFLDKLVPLERPPPPPPAALDIITKLICQYMI